MELPDDVVRIIREFSKPLTRPDWREGVPHAVCLKFSRMANILKFRIKHQYCNSSSIFCPELFDHHTSIFKLIEKHGEDIIPAHYGASLYSYLRGSMLKKTGYMKYDLEQNEWVYKSNLL